MRKRILAIALMLAGVAGCDSGPSQPDANSPYFRAPTPAESYCANQGLLRGSNDYMTCLERQSGVVKATPPVIAPQAGVEVFRDEHGNRYDGLGNRLDAQGRIIGPPVSKP